MSSVQAVFLFDVSAFKGPSIFSKEAFQKILLNIRLICLKILSEISGRSVKVRWGFKFFNSDGSPSQKMDKMPFSDANIESFEKLESEIGVHFERQVNSKPSPLSENSNSYAGNMGTGENNIYSTSIFSNYCPIKILQLALTQILCEYPWDVAEVCSPVKQTYREEQSDLYGQIKNYVFLVSQCPTDSTSFTSFFGRTLNSSFTQEVLMPRALHEKFVVTANIRLVWLDTYGVCSPAKVPPEEEKVHQSVHRLLVKLSGALVPLRALFQKHHVSTNASPSKGSGKGIPASENVDMSNITKAQNFISLDRLLPFSSIFNYYVTNPCHYSSNSSGSSSSLVLGSTTISIKVMPTCDTSIRISKKSDVSDVTSRPYPLRDKRKRNSWSSIQNVFQKWCKFTVQCTTVHDLCICPQSAYVCYPVLEKNLESHHEHTFRRLMMSISRKKLSLVVKCENSDGFSVFGVLSYLSLVSATIVMFDSSVSLMEIHSSQPTEPAHRIKNHSLEEFLQKELESSFHKEISALNDIPSVENINPVRSKAFAMCSMERWFVPRIGASAVAQQLGQTSSRKPSSSEKALEILHRFRTSTSVGKPAIKASSDSVFKEVRRSPRLKRSHSAVLNVSKRSASLVERSYHLKRNSTGSVSSDLSADVNCPLPKKQKVTTDVGLSTSNFTNEKDLLEHLHSIYKSALESEESLISCAQTLINVVKCYIQSKNMTDSQAALKNFIENNFLLPVSKINEKYDSCSDTGTEMKKKIKEYKIQVILMLELESILQPTSSEDCIEKVTGILRTMSFVAGPADLNQFLYDVLKPNYNHTLHEVLVEIGDELNVPFVSEIMSPSSVTDTASSIDGPGSTLSIGSLLSVPSSSSVAANNKNNRPRARRSVSFLHGTDPSGDFQKRQILVPSKSLRSRNHSNSNLVSIRHSPRLAAKRAARTPSKSKQDVKNVCRNLFDIETSGYSAKEGSIAYIELAAFSKEKPRTPKGRRVLKTDFVSATPPQKRGIYLKKKLQYYRRKNLASVSRSGIKDSPSKTQSTKGSRKSLHCKFAKNCSFYAATSNVKHRLNLEETSNEETDHAEISPIKSPSNLLPGLLNSPIKHPARRCSRKLFTTNSPVKKQYTPRKKSVSTGNRRLHQESTAEVSSKEDVGILKPRKLFTTNSPVKKQDTPRKNSVSTGNRRLHQESTAEVSSKEDVGILKPRKLFTTNSPVKKQHTPRKNSVSTGNRRLHQESTAEVSSKEDIGILKPKKLFTTNSPVKKQHTPRKSSVSTGNKRLHQESTAEVSSKEDVGILKPRKLFTTNSPLKKQRTPRKHSASTENKKVYQSNPSEMLTPPKDVDGHKSMKRPTPAVTPTKRQCTLQRNVVSSDNKKLNQNTAEMLTPCKDVDGIKLVKLFATNTPVKKQHTPRKNSPLSGKKRSVHKDAVEELSKAKDAEGIKCVKLFATNTPVKKQHTAQTNRVYTEIKKSGKRNCVVPVHGNSHRLASKNNVESTISVSSQASSSQKCTPIRKTEEFSANQLKISQNCSFTPPTPLGLLHLTTSPVVLSTRSKLKA